MSTQSTKSKISNQCMLPYKMVCYGGIVAVSLISFATSRNMQRKCSARASLFLASQECPGSGRMHWSFSAGCFQHQKTRTSALFFTPRFYSNARGRLGCQGEAGLTPARQARMRATHPVLSHRPAVREPGSAKAVGRVVVAGHPLHPYADGVPSPQQVADRAYQPHIFCGASTLGQSRADCLIVNEKQDVSTCQAGRHEHQECLQDGQGFERHDLCLALAQRGQNCALDRRCSATCLIKIWVQENVSQAWRLHVLRFPGSICVDDYRWRLPRAQQHSAWLDHVQQRWKNSRALRRLGLSS